MVGVPNLASGGYTVVASRDLTSAQLAAVIAPGGHAPWPWPSLAVTDPAKVAYHLTTRMDKIAVGFGRTYREALEAIMRLWANDDGFSPLEITS